MTAKHWTRSFCTLLLVFTGAAAGQNLDQDVRVFPTLPVGPFQDFTLEGLITVANPTDQPAAVSILVLGPDFSPPSVELTPVGSGSSGVGTMPAGDAEEVRIGTNLAPGTSWTVEIREAADPPTFNDIAVLVETEGFAVNKLIVEGAQNFRNSEGQIVIRTPVSTEQFGNEFSASMSRGPGLNTGFAVFSYLGSTSVAIDVNLPEPPTSLSGSGTRSVTTNIQVEGKRTFFLEDVFPEGTLPAQVPSALVRFRVEDTGNPPMAVTALDVVSPPMSPPGTIHISAKDVMSPVPDTISGPTPPEGEPASVGSWAFDPSQLTRLERHPFPPIEFRELILRCPVGEDGEPVAISESLRDMIISSHRSNPHGIAVVRKQGEVDTNDF